MARVRMILAGAEPGTYGAVVFTEDVAGTAGDWFPREYGGLPVEIEFDRLIDDDLPTIFPREHVLRRE